MNRALVTVVRSSGNEEMSRAMIMGVVGPEIRRIQAERDLMIWARKREKKDDIAELRAKHAHKPAGKIARRFWQAMGLMVMLREWYREQKRAA